MGRCILFLDEATLTSDVTVSSQHCRGRNDTNPHFTVQCRNQHYFKTNVWCGIFKDHFFRNTMNSECYLTFLRVDIFDFIDKLPITEELLIWYQDELSMDEY